MDAIPNTPPAADPWAIDGKFAAPDEHAQLLVVGAGPAGLAAARRAAALGLRVVLVDENPVPISLMGLDVPLFYGQRMNAAVQEQARMVERLVAANPGLEAAFDAGVDVRLGVTAWGAFARGPASGALPASVAGLSDGARSWMCGFDALILATGARDLVLGFDGVDLPGVMGARALESLLTRYDAFDGRRLVILGSGELAVRTALLALDRGLQVTALVEVLPKAQAAPDLLAALAARGVAVRTGSTILRAEAGATGVAAAVIGAAGDVAAGIGAAGIGAPERLDCDTICLAVGTVPAIELAGVLGCRLTYRGALGGHVPVLDVTGATSTPGVFCAGDCAGIVPEPACTVAGEAAADAASAWLGGGAARRAPAEAASMWLARNMADTAAGRADARPAMLAQAATRGEVGQAAAGARLVQTATDDAVDHVAAGAAEALLTRSAMDATAGQAAAGAIPASPTRGEALSAGEPAVAAGPDGTDYRLAWMRALLATGNDQVSACLCEDVSRGELLGISPPRYLGCTSDKVAARDSGTLLQDGPFNPDQIKRLTRAGMGVCQGRRCREQVALTLALASGAAVSAIPLASYRPPVRPVSLGVLADAAESPEMRAGWDVWFGIRTQWVPYDMIGTEAETAMLAQGGGGNMHA